MNFSAAIKLVRQKQLLSQELFAKELNLAISTVNRWETGKSKPNLSTMKQLKAFCERNKIDYEQLEKSWLES